MIDRKWDQMTSCRDGEGSLFARLFRGWKESIDIRQIGRNQLPEERTERVQLEATSAHGEISVDQSQENRKVTRACARDRECGIGFHHDRSTETSHLAEHIQVVEADPLEAERSIPRREITGHLEDLTLTVVVAVHRQSEIRIQEAEIHQKISCHLDQRLRTKSRHNETKNRRVNIETTQLEFVCTKVQIYQAFLKRIADRKHNTKSDVQILEGRREQVLEIPEGGSGLDSNVVHKHVSARLSLKAGEKGRRDERREAHHEASFNVDGVQPTVAWEVTEGRKSSGGVPI
mmetsp:Transcript_29932/g.75314  ORF Transcript_29932/g.75314 Transcript_29932/m.75314 type:complete len:289 (-) Transcript_29932:832-1698(-)